MRSGLDLLDAARTRTPSAQSMRGGAADAVPDERAALVAALITEFEPADAPLIRELTRQETTWVAAEDAGCGDVLLACCWLLFMIGHVEDAPLIWRAKNLNFDTHSYIDSVFLIPSGVAATAEFARSAGVLDLAEWVEDDWLADEEEAAQRWRAGTFFARVPPAAAPVEQLAAWLRQ